MASERMQDTAYEMQRERAERRKLKRIDLTVPGRVWDDCLNPAATDMQEALWLPAPVHQRRGRGFSVVYRDVPTARARDLAAYMRDRANTLQGQDDPANSSMYSAMRRTAEKIMAQIEQETAR